jgi:hypothetical protein
MKFQEQKEKLTAYFDIFQQQFEKIRISEYKNDLSQFDTDILKHTLKEIYNALDVLLKIDEDISEKTTENETNPSINEPPSTEFIEIETELDKSENTFEEAISEKPIEDQIMFAEETNIEEQIKIDFETPEEPVVEKEEVHIESSMPEQKNQENQILYDKFKTSNTSLHDKLHNNSEDTTIGKRFGNNPVKDLKKAIGINERFTYINELFHGSKAQFDAFIDNISNVENKESGLQLLEETIKIQKWDTSKISYLSLSTLINRFLLEK